MKKFLLAGALFLFFLSSTFAQKVAIKNNLAYDAFLTPNLSLEVALSSKVTLDTQVGANFFFFEKNAQSPKYKSKKWSHWLVQPELRLWTCEVFNGWFVGAHAFGGLMNVGGVSTPFILQNKDNQMAQYRYEGWFAGGGISAGYHWMLSPRFSIEASVGAGYARVMYDKFNCTTCGTRVEQNKAADYLGPTKATISLVYMIK
ncbi:MAG: DUF3575 domain-containing protein [Porphyromonas sp.]|nr:DUF3575 domain-containing protein [Porphyromonas sp.]